MLRWRPAFQFLHVAVVCLCFAAAATAQTDRATLTGTVHDSSGAVVPCMPRTAGGEPAHPASTAANPSAAIRLPNVTLRGY